MTEIVYLYDGSFEGLLTCVFEAYYRRENPAEIEPEYDSQLMLGCEYVRIETDTEKSDRVFTAAKNKISQSAIYNAYCTYLSSFRGKEKNILAYLRLGFKTGKNVDMRLTDDSVRFVNDTARTVSGEAHRYKGVLRFSELSNGAMYSEIEPKHNVLPLLAEHFARRLACVPWIIFDTNRRLCCVYDTSEWYMRYTDFVRAELSEEEQTYRELWREFYDTIEIKERHNEKCRMTCMPKRYWRKLTELNYVKAP